MSSEILWQIYQTFFAGGAGHTYGAGPIWPILGNRGEYSCGYTWQQALEFPAGANFASVIKNIFCKNINGQPGSPINHWSYGVPVRVKI